MIYDLNIMLRFSLFLDSERSKQYPAQNFGEGVSDGRRERKWSAEGSEQIRDLLKLPAIYVPKHYSPTHHVSLS